MFFSWGIFTKTTQFVLGFFHQHIHPKKPWKQGSPSWKIRIAFMKQPTIRMTLSMEADSKAKASSQATWVGIQRHPWAPRGRQFWVYCGMFKGGILIDFFKGWFWKDFWAIDFGGMFLKFFLVNMFSRKTLSNKKDSGKLWPKTLRMLEKVAKNLTKNTCHLW